MSSIDNRIPNISIQTPYQSGLLTNNVEQGKTEGVPFSEYFSEAVSNVAGADYLDKTTNVGLMTGTLDNMHSATMAAEKADIMLNLTIQVRNKVVESYQEVMRMQM